jgi:hypothetical protein
VTFIQEADVDIDALLAEVEDETPKTVVPSKKEKEKGKEKKVGLSLANGCSS